MEEVGGRESLGQGTGHGGSELRIRSDQEQEVGVIEAPQGHTGLGHGVGRAWSTGEQGLLTEDVAGTQGLEVLVAILPRSQVDQSGSNDVEGIAEVAGVEDGRVGGPSLFTDPELELGQGRFGQLL